MAAPKRPTHVVLKPIYFSPKEGELKPGAHITLTGKQAEKLEARGMVKALKDVDTVDASGAASEASEKELTKVKADLKKAQDEVKSKDEELTKVKADLKTAEDALKAVGK